MVICFVLGKDSELADDKNDIDYDSKYEHTGWNLETSAMHFDV